MELYWPVYIWIHVYLLWCWESALALQRYYMEDICDTTIDMTFEGIPAGRLSVTRRVKYRSRLDCHVTIVAPKARHLIIVFRQLEIEWEDICDDDFVQLFDGASVEAPMVKGLERRICGHRVPSDSYVTSGEALTVFFQSDIYKQDDGFELVFTAFHKAETCLEDEFRCDNGRCIAASLECNNFSHCGDGSDTCKVSADVLMGIILSVFLLTVAGVGVITIYRKKNKLKKSMMETKAEVKSAPLPNTCACGSELKTLSQGSHSPKRPIRKWRPYMGERIEAVWATNVMTAAVPYPLTQRESEEGRKQEKALKLKRASV